MKIGVLGPIWLDIPPKGYGGTELVVYNLVNSLSKNNEVYLFGPKTAKVKSHLIATTDKPLRETGHDWNEVAPLIRHITKAFDTVNSFDILHVHLNTVQDYFALPLSTYSKTPVIFTPHFLLPHEEKYIERAKILDRYDFLPFSSISDSQRKGSKLNFVGTVYNGIDMSKFPFSDTPKDYFVWMGKMVPWKGAREAIIAAKKAGVKLYLIGPRDNTLARSFEYFDKKVKPLIDGKQIVWVGELGFEEKTKLVKEAKALLNPITWNEPFGMVMAESMALGTPVISFRRGAAPELIDEGKGGFLVDDVSEMARKIKEVEKLDRGEVRKNGERFSAERMAEGYEKVYKEVIRDWKKYLKSNKI